MTLVGGGAGAMRIIGGEYRSRRLKPPGGGAAGLRPTSDYVRENIFNLLREAVCGARFLDLFAGTGAVGLEALSRGAAKCVFVDSAPECAALIRANCKALGIAPERFGVVEADTLDFLRRERDARFDIVFLDPPYDAGLFEKTMRRLAERPAVVKGGIVVGQGGDAADEFEYDGLALIDQRRYGRTWVSVWEKKLRVTSDK